MGRRWWQKEARRAQAAAEIEVKNTPAIESNIDDGSVDATIEHDSIMSDAFASATSLEQAIEEFDNHQIADEPQVQENHEVDEVKVPGITMVHNNFRSNNKKNKRR